MFQALINRFSATVTIQIWENRIKVLDVNSSVLFDDMPVIAIGATEGEEKYVVEVGKNATLCKGLNIKILKPFSNPRILIDDFKIAELVVRYAIEKGLGRKGFFSPKIFVEVLREFENDLTSLECQAIIEIVENAGAREVVLKDRP